ncbi:MAG: hypothetical protein U1C46_00080 [Bacteroidales bacterium]|nr:hypothetical protein [Bacteroidales bacterium]MDZ4203187.1 hypothetical protein [Bacteroidales bacterium]
MKHRSHHILVRIIFLSIMMLTLFIKGFAQSTIEGSFNHDGINRTYRIYIPAAYSPSQPVPLLLNLHGYGSNNVKVLVGGLSHTKRVMIL